VLLVNGLIKYYFFDYFIAIFADVHLIFIFHEVWCSVQLQFDHKFTDVVEEGQPVRWCRHFVGCTDQKLEQKQLRCQCHVVVTPQQK